MRKKKLNLRARVLYPEGDPEERVTAEYVSSSRIGIEVFSNFRPDGARFKRNFREARIFSLATPNGRIVRTVGDDPHPSSNPRRDAAPVSTVARQRSAAFVCEHSRIGFNNVYPSIRESV